MSSPQGIIHQRQLAGPDRNSTSLHPMSYHLNIKHHVCKSHIASVKDARNEADVKLIYSYANLLPRDGLRPWFMTRSCSLHCSPLHPLTRTLRSRVVVC